MVESKWVRFGAVGIAIIATASIGIGIGVSTRNNNSSSSIAIKNKDDSNISGPNDYYEDVGKEATTNDEEGARFVDPSPKLAENFGTDNKFGDKIVDSYIMTNENTDIIDSAVTAEDPCATEGGRGNLRSSVSAAFNSMAEFVFEAIAFAHQ